MATIGNQSRDTVQDRVAVRIFERPLLEIRTRDDFVWSNVRNWRFGFYFGKDDSRLWVPRRCACGAPQDHVRVINYAHPMGRKAFRLLMFGYAVGVTLAGTLVAAAFGVRW